MPLSKKVILNSVPITEQLLLFRMQARSFFGSYCKGYERRPKQKLQMNRWDSDMEGDKRPNTECQNTARQGTRQKPFLMWFVDFKQTFETNSCDKLWVTMMDIWYPREHYQNGFVLRNNKSDKVCHISLVVQYPNGDWWGRPLVDIKVDYKLECE